MSSSLRIDKLAADCNRLESEMDFVYKSIAPSIEFSNTGRRGEKKYFSISLLELLETLKNIEYNLTEYEASKEYVEAKMRNLFSRTITSKTVNALSTVQTLPLFSVINKFIYTANDLDTPFFEKHLNVSSDLIRNAIRYLEAQLPDNNKYLESLILNVEEPTPSFTVQSGPFGENIIYYGAPGTGKSYQIDKLCTESNSIRTVFHPETQNSDFIGCLKPSMNGSEIVYSFRPGPLCLALKLAHEKVDEHTFLIIEEINRAAAAAVFGELFQLLDRDNEGKSTYNITVSDPDMLQYLKKEAPSILEGDKLRIPKNLSLYATMNSSDQAVMPMDTAFKRRWKFKYVPIDFEVNSGPKGTIPLWFSDGILKDISWQVIASSINEILEHENIPEDRFLGPWFLSESEVSESATALISLKGKLLLYLWDDVLRHNNKTTIFSGKAKSYSSLIKLLEDKESIFSENLEEIILTKINTISPSIITEEPADYSNTENHDNPLENSTNPAKA